MMTFENIMKAIKGVADDKYIAWRRRIRFMKRLDHRRRGDVLEACNRQGISQT
jgi:hypothetical protein